MLHGMLFDAGHSNLKLFALVNFILQHMRASSLGPQLGSASVGRPTGRDSSMDRKTGAMTKVVFMP